MERKRIYIAGPISKGNLADNVNQATDAFVKLAKAGLAPFCPHWSVYSKSCIPANYKGEGTICYGTVNGNDEMSHADWIGVDLPWVEVAHMVLRLPGESTGADAEVEHAKQNNIPVFTDIDSLIYWSALAE
jgi:hypothetical protein